MENMIDVINYYSFGVSVKTKDNSYFIEPMTNGMETRLPLTIDEIKYINTTSAAFKSGLLFFNEDVEKEIYEDCLRIFNWKNILKPSEIKDIILNPTFEGLKKIIEIKEIIIFEIVRGIFVSLKNKNYDISTRVEKIINTRYEELNKGIRNSYISLKEKDVAKPISSEELQFIKEENNNLKSELGELKDMLKTLMSTQKTEEVTEKVTEDDKTKTSAKSKSKTKTVKTETQTEE